MFAQNLFYYSVSAAIIVVALFVCISMIYWLVILKRISGVINHFNKIAENLKEKIKISTFMALITQGIKEVTEFIKERRQK
ncbi:MAG: hypothetical protein PHV78_03245 [Patescibacteria group bacterium]|nr:hypothetical protein [Patescibacteria group bacterium]MDD5121598.1 hypothetical protein [Patescibacteria group bacterium]MDD5222156.1 hypothetical protein [Patescibacteria group bacterium]MDD5396238.1 hypothetical protein [Patescibacteria group bacterium]